MVEREGQRQPQPEQAGRDLDRLAIDGRLEREVEIGQVNGPRNVACSG
jgi:hypothetical protein